MSDLLVLEQSHVQLTCDNAILILLAHQRNILLATGDSSKVKAQENFLALANFSNIASIPTLLTASQATKENSFLQEIVEICPNSQIVSCLNDINAWQDLNFKTAVKKLGRTKLILAGVAKDICFAFTAISAASEGFEVYAVVDASGDWNSTVAQAAVERMIEAGCKITNRVAITAQLMKILGKEAGNRLH